MTYRLVLRLEAETDLAAAFDWYEAKKAGLGHEFLQEIRIALDKVSKEPLRYQGVYRNVRRVLSRRFPYKILFVTEERSVVVIGVVHAKRRASIWKKRLQ